MKGFNIGIKLICLNFIVLQDIEEASLLRVLEVNSPEWYWICMGCFGSLLGGFVQPGFGVIFGGIVDVS